MKPHKLLAVFSCLALLGCPPAAASDDANWPQFREPNGSGAAHAFEPPGKVTDGRGGVVLTVLTLRQDNPPRISLHLLTEEANHPEIRTHC
jgi:hypothetical protein